MPDTDDEDNCTVGAGVPSRVYTRDVAIAAATADNDISPWLRARGATRRCLKCNWVSGDNWEQCKGACPIPDSPHYDELAARAFARLPLAKQDEYGRDETRLHDVP